VQIQVEKERIEKSSLQLESLKYQKNILLNKIQIAAQFQVRAMDQLNPVLARKHYVRDHEEIRDFLESEFAQRKECDEALRQLSKKKQKDLETLSEKQKIFCDDLPKHLTKLAEDLRAISEIYKVNPAKNPI